MTNFFKVLSNLNHNGTIYNAGEVIEGDLATFKGLVNDKVLAVIEGAKTFEEAVKIASAEVETEVEKVEEEVKAPANTWGPKKEETKPADADTTTDKPVELPKEDLPVLSKFEVVNPESGIETSDGITHQVGDIIELDANSKEANFFIEGGNIKQVVAADASANL